MCLLDQPKIEEEEEEAQYLEPCCFD